MVLGTGWLPWGAEDASQHVFERIFLWDLNRNSVLWALWNLNNDNILGSALNNIGKFSPDNEVLLTIENFDDIFTNLEAFEVIKNHPVLSRLFEYTEVWNQTEFIGGRLEDATTVQQLVSDLPTFIQFLNNPVSELIMDKMPTDLNIIMNDLPESQFTQMIAGLVNWNPITQFTTMTLLLNNNIVRQRIADSANTMLILRLLTMAPTRGAVFAGHQQMIFDFARFARPEALRFIETNPIWFAAPFHISTWRQGHPTLLDIRSLSTEAAGSTTGTFTVPAFTGSIVTIHQISNFGVVGEISGNAFGTVVYKGFPSDPDEEIIIPRSSNPEVKNHFTFNSQPDVPGGFRFVRPGQQIQYEIRYGTGAARLWNVINNTITASGRIP